MIRRDVPWGSAAPESWLLISQTDHARLSLRLAEAWGGDAVPPIVCPSGEPDHPLAAVRREFLEAVDHHDDGWRDWRESPGIDPANGRPYSFTEMPPADAQRIWTDSIEACRGHGLLAGWMVASHFSALQSKRDGDYPEWVEWLSLVDRQRAEWLTKWLGQSADHTQGLAACCLAWLQALDWISLWLCCRCPAMPNDGDIEPLVIGGDTTGWPEITFEPQGSIAAAEREVRVTPWPFAERCLRLVVEGRSVPVGDYRRPESPQGNDRFSNGSRLALTWRLLPG